MGRKDNGGQKVTTLHGIDNHPSRTNNFNHQNSSVCHAYCGQLEERVESSFVGLEKERSFLAAMMVSQQLLPTGISNWLSSRHIVPEQPAIIQLHWYKLSASVYFVCQSKDLLENKSWDRPKLKSLCRLSVLHHIAIFLWIFNVHKDLNLLA